MRKSILFATILALCLMTVSATDPNGRWFAGYVLVDGIICPDGLVVEGWISTTNHINSTVGATTTGKYSMLYPEYNNPPGNPGGQLGQTINFKIGALTASTTALFNASKSGIVPLNLSFSDSVPPSAPASLSATEVAPGVINITWTAASDNIQVRKYIVYRGNSTGVTSSTGTNVGNNTVNYYTDNTSTTNGETYYYVVTAMDTATESDDSSEASETVTDNTPPSAPAGLAAADVSGQEGTLFISWTANTEPDLANYTLYYSPNNASWSVETQTAARNFTDTSLNDGTTYYYRLMAMDTSGNPSANTSSIKAIPLDDVAPNPATSVVVADVATAENKLLVSWTASVSSDVVGYKLYRNGTLVSTLVGQANVSYLDTNVVDGNTYQYRVSSYDEVPNYAANASGTGAPVDDLKPKQVVVASTSSNNRTVNVTWTAVTQNVDNSAISDLTGYLVYMNGTSGFRLVRTLGNTVVSYYNNTLQNSVTYYFKVSAFDDSGNFGANSTIFGVTPSERPTIAAVPGTGATIKSSVLINITVSSGQNMDLVFYSVFNTTGLVSTGQTNTSIGLAQKTYRINPSSWEENELHTIYVFANDTNSQVTQSNFTYTVDDTLPTVTNIVVSDADLKVKSSTTNQYNVTVADSTSVASVTMGNATQVSMANIIGNVYSVARNASSLGCTARNGPCKLKVVATDAAGNINNTEIITITVDDVAPGVALAWSSDTDRIVRSVTNFLLNATVSDTNTVSSVVTQSVASLQMSSYAANKYSRQLNTSALGCSAGACVITFVATDEVGNINSSIALSFTVDDTSPTIRSVTVSDDYVQNNTAVLVVVNATDAYNVTSVVAEGTSLSQIGTSSLWNSSVYLVYGNSDIDVVAVDKAGNTATDNSTSYSIDDIPPVISSVAISDNYVRNNTNVTVTVNATDIAIYSVTAEGTALTRSGDIWTGTIALANSPVNVVALDNASNSAVDNSLAFTIDDTAPVINSVVLADSYVRPGQTVLVTVNVTDARTVSVTANSVSLTNTSASIWTGTLTMPAASSVVAVVATDAAGNIGRNNATGFTVDAVSPVISVVSPTEGQEITNSDGNVTFSFAVIDRNISVMNISMDLARYTYGTATNGTKSKSFTGLKAGTHVAILSATDQAGNSVSGTLTFRMVRNINMSDVLGNLQSTLGSGSITVLANQTDISSNESVGVNRTLSMTVRLNVSAVDVFAQIPSFDGLSANWENTFVVITNSSSAASVRAAVRSGSAVQLFALFQNATNFLASFNIAVLTFNQYLAGRDVLYIDDDEGNSVYRLAYCSSVPTSVAAATDACYTNTSANVTLYLPHFSGGAIANDTVAPIINITSPGNSSTQNNSYFTFGLKVYEANPNSVTFCNYTLWNGTQSVDTDMDIADFTNDGSTLYEYTQSIYNLRNGLYNLTVFCSDMRSQLARSSHSFAVADSVAPVVSSSGPSGTQSSSTSTASVTLHATTTERSLCRYSASNVSYATMSIALGTSAYSLTHETSLSYSADTSVTYYVVCRDVNSRNSSSVRISYAVDITPAATSTGGGGGSFVAPVQLPSYSKMWQVLDTVETVVSIDKDGLHFTRLAFTPLETLASPSLTVSVLDSWDSSSGMLPLLAYQYVRVAEENFRQVSYVKVSFRVEKSWLSENSVSSGRIALYRYDGTWLEQATRLVSEDSDYVYYEASCSGLSFFAIGVAAEPEEVATPEVVVPAPQPKESPVPQLPEAEKAPAESASLTYLVIVLGLLIVVAGIAFGVYEYVQHRKRDN